MLFRSAYVVNSHSALRGDGGVHIILGPKVALGVQEHKPASVCVLPYRVDKQGLKGDLIRLVFLNSLDHCLNDVGGDALFLVRCHVVLTFRVPEKEQVQENYEKDPYDDFHII